MTTRKKILYTIAIVSLLLVLLIGIAFQRVLTFANLATNYTEHFNGTCQPIFGVVGGEDVTIDDNGIAWVSATDRYAIAEGKNTRGKIMLLDLNQQKPVPIDISPDEPADFRPHGIYLLQLDDGQKFLFVVNHPSGGRPEGGGHHILRYQVGENNRLTLTRSFEAEAIASPNDVVAVDQNRFYWTNDLGTEDGSALQLAEILMALPWGSVGYFDGQQAKIVAEGLAFANGIYLSEDQRTLYVAETGAKKLSIFDRDLATGGLTLIKDIMIESGLDNLEPDKAGHLWTAAHPKPFAFGEHAGDRNKHAPSQVFMIDVVRNKITEIYYNHGSALNGAATAAVWGKRLVLGPVFDDHLLLCNRR